MKNFILHIASLILLVSFTWGQQQAVKIKIASIDVIGTKTATPAVVIAASGLSAGMEATQEDFSEGVKQLWSLGLFSDVKILSDRESPEGLFLIISVEEYPRLSKVVLEGNKKLKTDEIDEALNLHPGQALTPFIVYESQRIIQDLYYDDGYLLAEIEPSTFEGEKENSRGVKFSIVENKKVSVGEIRFTGNTQLSDRKLKKKMDMIKEERWWKFWADAEFSIDNLRADERLIEEYMHSIGYRDAEILGDSLYYSEDLKKMYFDIILYEGEKYKYGEVKVTGNTIFESEDILSALGISRGDQYNSEKLMEAIELGVRSPYMDKGYLYCQINPIELPVAADTVSLTLEIAEMNPVHIRHINIVGNDKTKESVIRRELRIFPGDLFSRTALMRSQREVMILNYFGNVVPDVIPYDDDEIDLVFEVEEKNTGTATASAGYSERDGFIGTVGLQFPNFRGNGQQLSFSFQRAYSYEALSISFVEPWLFNTPNLLGVSIFDQDRSQGNSSSFSGYSSSYSTPYDVHTTGGSITFGRRFQWPDNYFRGRWTFRGAVDRYGEVYYQSVYDRVNPADLEQTSGISLNQSITRDSRNAPEFPTSGSVLTLNSVYSGKFLGGNESFFKQKASLEWYTPIWKDKLTMRSYFEGGILEQLEDDSTHIIPYDEYFFMGGAGLIYGSALRGYAERSVGTLEGNAYFGGMASFKYTLEMRFLLSPSPMMYLIGFAEAGNVWDNFDSSSLFDLKRSAGIGGRVIMPPLGMLGIDIGWGFDNDPVPTWRTPEYHFIFGQQF
ncbi:MAG: outer membrane protein assembly factor BamA [Candidatus Marinimicrobia bacterium]|nr:outer membrane protein assembly factor BamA [Candidatus Neomarinimicrobiota bacterium]MBL7121019.1 outer membrane protein assembly factor BamA [Candidatus Neomarinimicrobiota bacterium]